MRIILGLEPDLTVGYRSELQHSVQRALKVRQLLCGKTNTKKMLLKLPKT